jgi:Zinc-binding dehydrogenase
LDLELGFNPGHFGQMKFRRVRLRLITKDARLRREDREVKQAWLCYRGCELTIACNKIFARPPGMSALEAAAPPVNYFTAWQLGFVMGGLKWGETILVHSAGGGVGIAATQIAKHNRRRVIGTASASKHTELRALGVDHLIDYRKEVFEVRAREITDGRGVDSFLMPSVATRSGRDIACSRRPGGSARHFVNVIMPLSRQQHENGQAADEHRRAPQSWRSGRHAIGQWPGQ